jgi:small conductance mechanosensitive channel
MRLKRSLDAMDVKLPSLTSVVLTGFEGATRVKGSRPPKTTPSEVVDASGSAGPARPKTPKAPRAPKPPTTGGTT